MTNEQLLEFVGSWAAKNPDFVNNFVLMLQEYRAVAEAAGLDVEKDLPNTKACLEQLGELFDSMEVFSG